MSAELSNILGRDTQIYGVSTRFFIGSKLKSHPHKRGEGNYFRSTPQEHPHSSKRGEALTTYKSTTEISSRQYRLNTFSYP
jgi:hypothetical protein